MASTVIPIAQADFPLPLLVITLILQSWTPDISPSLGLMHQLQHQLQYKPSKTLWKSDIVQDNFDMNHTK